MALGKTLAVDFWICKGKAPRPETCSGDLVAARELG